MGIPAAESSAVYRRVDQGEHMIVRAPIRVEADGSFRMNAPFVMVWMPTYWWGAVPLVKKLRNRLRNRRSNNCKAASPPLPHSCGPGWEMLLKSHPVRDHSSSGNLGKRCSNCGRVHTRTGCARQKIQPCLQLLNQHIVVITFAEG